VINKLHALAGCIVSDGLGGGYTANPSRIDLDETEASVVNHGFCLIKIMTALSSRELQGSAFLPERFISL